MLVTMVFQTLYFLIDLYWVGRLGTEAVAGVGIAGNLTFIVLALTQMLGVGTTAVVSHAVGSKDHDRALLLFNQSQVLAMVTGVVFMVVGMAARWPYANAMGANPQTAAMAAEYLKWFIPAMALQFALVAMGSALRAVGNFKPGMVVSTATVIINMILAPILIFGWGTGRPLGVAGAAISSLVAVAIGIVWLSTYFLPRDSYLRFETSPMDAPVGQLVENAAHRVARRIRIRHYGCLRRVGLFDHEAVRAERPGRVRNRDESGAGGLHARRGARVFGRARGRAEFRGKACRPGKEDLQRRGLDGRRGNARAHSPMLERADIAGWTLLGRSCGHFDRCRVPADYLVQLRGFRAHLRSLEHLPGDGQRDPVADCFGGEDCAGSRGDSDRSSAPWVRAPLGLVAVRRRHGYPTRPEPAAAAPGVWTSSSVGSKRDVGDPFGQLLAGARAVYLVRCRVEHMRIRCIM